MRQSVEIPQGTDIPEIPQEVPQQPDHKEVKPVPEEKPIIPERPEVTPGKEEPTIIPTPGKAKSLLIPVRHQNY